MNRTYINQNSLKALHDLFPALEIAETTDPAVTVSAEYLLDFLSLVHKDEAFDFDLLGNLTAVDYPDALEMVYHLHSRRKGHTLTVKTRLPKDKPAVDSITPIWAGAGFQEREVYDLMGIHFNNLPDQRRILLPDDFSGHPLRKDFKPQQAEKRC